MTEELPRWSIEGEFVDQIPLGVKALVEELLTENAGDPVAALVGACRIVGAMRPAISRGMVRSGPTDGVEIIRVLDILAEGAGKEKGPG